MFYYIKWGFESRLKLYEETLEDLIDYIKWGFESRLKHISLFFILSFHYIKWGFESRLKPLKIVKGEEIHYIKWGFESRLKPSLFATVAYGIISNGDFSSSFDTKRKVEENLAKLKSKGMIQRVGGTRGYWEVIA